MDASLPAEIIELVIDHLRGDQKSLLACRLVCSWWRTNAHKWLSLNATIAVENFYTKSEDIVSTRKLLDLLSSNHQTICSQITRLTLHGPDQMGPIYDDIIYRSDRSAYPVFNSALEACLPYMTHIRSLSFCRFEFSQLSTQTRSQLAALSHVTSLSCNGVTYPSFQDMLAPYPNLRELRIGNFALDSEAQSIADTIEFRPLTSITSLELTIGETALDLLRSSTYIQPQSIVSLTINAGGDDHIAAIAEFLTLTERSLEHFTLGLDNPEGFVYTVQINLTHNSALKTLTLVTTPEWPSWMDRMIKTAPPKVQIEVKTTFFLYPGTPVDEWDTSDLEYFFSEHLERNIMLKFIERGETRGLVKSPDFHDMIKSRFPETFERGLVNFDVDCKQWVVME